MQVSLAKFIQGSACDPGEPTESDEMCDVAQRGDTRDDLDYSQSVFVTENGSHYHAVQYDSICACPHVHGTEVTLREAIKRGNLPCGVCEPVDYRREQPETQPATVEEWV